VLQNLQGGGGGVFKGDQFFEKRKKKIKIGGHEVREKFKKKLGGGGGVVSKRDQFFEK